MKCLQICIVIALLFLSNAGVEATKIRAKGAGSNIWQLCLGMVGSLAGGNHAAIDKCLPKSWRTSPGDNGSATSNFVASSGPLKIIGKILGGALKLACKFKNKIIGFLKGKLSRRRYRREFLAFEGTMKWGFLKKVWNKTKRAARSVGRAVSRGASYLWNKAVGIFKTIVGAIRSCMRKIQAFFRSKTWLTIKKVVSCIGTLRAAGMAVIKNVRGFINAVRTLLTGIPGIIQVLVGAICNWRAFKQAIDYLINAVKSQGAARWNRIGRFIGQLIVAIGGSA
jgi:hypothetical protein